MEIKVYFCVHFYQADMLRKFCSLLFVLVSVYMAFSCKDKDKEEKPANYHDETEFHGVGGTDSAGQDRIKAAKAAAEDDTPPAAVDGDFEDFLYAFRTSKKFQSDRIVLPFEVKSGNSTSSISDLESVVSSYKLTDGDYYIKLYIDTKDEELDHSDIVSASVENIDLASSSVCSFNFSKADDKWYLCSESKSNMDSHGLSSFLSFYSKFVSDADYRKCHLPKKLPLVVEEYGETEANTSFIVPEQVDAMLEFPKGPLTTIQYGQSYDNNANTIIMKKCGKSNGALEIFTFTCKNGEWSLSKYEG